MLFWEIGTAVEISVLVNMYFWKGNSMKKVLTVILLIIGGLVANILVNAAVIAVWGFNDSTIPLSVIVGAAAVAAVCALAVVICNKTSVRRRMLLPCSQAPIFAVAILMLIDSAIRYYDVTHSDYNDMWSGLRYWGAQLGLTVGTAAIITVSVTTAALALTLGITYYKKKSTEII